jgi:hypothetical protein
MGTSVDRSASALSYIHRSLRDLSPIPARSMLRIRAGSF